VECQTLLLVTCKPIAMPHNHYNHLHSSFLYVFIDEVLMIGCARFQQVW